MCYAKDEQKFIKKGGIIMDWVIYKENGKFRATTEHNFNARISDARAVYNLDDFETLSDVVEYFEKYMCTSRKGVKVGIIVDTSAI